MKFLLDEVKVYATLLFLFATYLPRFRLKQSCVLPVFYLSIEITSVYHEIIDLFTLYHIID